MKKFALIPTREALPNSVISSYLKKAGWDPIFLPGYSNIFEAFVGGAKLCDIKAEDYVILCHDDIDIVTSPDYFNSLIERELKNPKIGFLGVAGTKFLKESGVWWEGLNNFSAGSPLNALSGFVSHGNRKSNHINYYGPHGDVVVLDGLFMCTTGKVLNTIKTGKPDYFEGDWDFYDIYYTSQAHLKGFTNKTVPIHIIHASGGTIDGKDSWHSNREAFCKQASEHLPMFVR